MHNRLIFEVDGDPVAKQRARTGKGFAYTPEKTRRFEQKVAYLGKMAMKEQKWAFADKDTPLMIKVTSYLKMPKSWSQKKKAENFGKWCLKNIDGSNLLKAVEDGLNHSGIWHDDCIVACGLFKKYWHEDPSTIIEVIRI